MSRTKETLHVNLNVVPRVMWRVKCWSAWALSKCRHSCIVAACSEITDIGVETQKKTNNTRVSSKSSRGIYVVVRGRKALGVAIIADEDKEQAEKGFK